MQIGGVGVYIAESLQHKKVTFESKVSRCEQLWTRVKCPNSRLAYVIGTIYSHPSSNPTDFTDYLNDAISKLNSTKINFLYLVTVTDPLCNTCVFSDF